jgi:hypothetical protein
VGGVVRDLARRGLSGEAVFGDLSTIATSRALGERLARVVRPGATLVHNAGVWPARLVRNADGYETSFMVNTAAPTLVQEPLLRAGALRRILVIAAGAMVKGRFDADRTPPGEDFSALRTYCDTKLGQAVALRAAAREYPEVDMAAVHPGIVRTDLGERPGIVGWLLRQVKRRWETPEVCAERLTRVLARERWAPAPGEARWMLEERDEPWPAITDWVADAVRVAIASVRARRS